MTRLEKLKEELNIKQKLHEEELKPLIEERTTLEREEKINTIKESVGKYYKLEAALIGHSGITYYKVLNIKDNYFNLGVLYIKPIGDGYGTIGIRDFNIYSHQLAKEVTPEKFNKVYEEMIDKFTENK